MANKQAAKRRAQRARRAIAKKCALGFCIPCDKFLWPTREKADQRIEELKAQPGVKKPYLLNSYRCLQGGDGFHIGHDFKLRLGISLGIGESK
jgi:hypothetical protein